MSVKDHLGNEYETKKERAKAYGLSPSTVADRLKIGMPLEEALTTPAKATPPHKCKDHKNNEYPSFAAMCKAYNLSTTTVRRRLEQGCPLKEALTLSKNTRCQTKYTDHLGNKFASEKEMCRYWQIDYGTYRGRIKRGWTIEKALTTPTNIKKRRTFTIDGVKYDNVSELCKAYNIERWSFTTHIENGLSAKEAIELTIKNKEARKYYKKPSRNTCCYDHLGIEYPNLVEMAKAYGINAGALRIRLNKGMPIEKALTAPLCRTFVKMEEHIGETVRNKQGHLATCIAVKRIGKQTNIIVRFEDGLEKMCRYDTFKKGGVLHPLDNKAHKCIDHLGQEYPSERAMCRAYNIASTTFSSRIKKGYSLEEALTLPSQIINVKNIRCVYFKEFNQEHYYKCNSKDWDKAKILTLEEIYNL